MSSDAQHPSGPLTPYKPGSLREAWHFVLPLIITAASASMMMFVDRLILAQYSTKAMTAVASAGMASAVFIFSLVGLTAISEVFVGQYNGAGEYKNVSKPVWQMIWLSFMAAFLFVPVGLFAAPFFVADPYDGLGVPYFQWIMVFGIFPAMQAALAGFFVGTGRPRIVTAVALGANGLNLVFVYALVFGVGGWLPAMGTQGAAMGTALAEFVQFLMLLIPFLNKYNREKYGTDQPAFDGAMFKKCLHIAWPSAVSHILELGAWAVQMNMMARLGELYITVLAIGQSLFLLLLFMADGLHKGTSALASNYMGSGHYEWIPKVVASMRIIHLIFVGVMALTIFTSPDRVIELFYEGDYDPEFKTMLFLYTRQALIWVLFFILVDGFQWIYSGVLVASGDTRFIMVTNGINVWGLGILPLYLMVEYGSLTPDRAWMMVFFFGAWNLFCYYLRYRMGGWRSSRLLEK